MTRPLKPDFILNILLRAAGSDPRVVTVHKQVGGKLDGRPIQRGAKQYGQLCPVNFTSIELFGSIEKEQAMRKLATWLTRHRSTIRRLRAEKWIEVGTGLLPDQAYEQMRFPPVLLRAAAAADCALIHTCYALITNRNSMQRRRVA